MCALVLGANVFGASADNECAVRDLVVDGEVVARYNVSRLLDGSFRYVNVYILKGTVQAKFNDNTQVWDVVRTENISK